MTLVEVGTVSIAPEIELNSPIATTKAGGIAIGAGIVIALVILLVGLDLLKK